jgi:hypothetical protein
MILCMQQCVSSNCCWLLILDWCTVTWINPWYFTCPLTFHRRLTSVIRPLSQEENNSSSCYTHEYELKYYNSITGFIITCMSCRGSFPCRTTYESIIYRYREMIVPHVWHLSMALQPFVGPWSLFQFLNLFTQSVGLLGRGFSPSQGHYLRRGHHKHR